MREQWYLCRVPWNGYVILLAKGSFKEMMLFKDLAGDLTNVS